MYLIGIDFGHGETTVSCFNTNDIIHGVRHLKILDGGSDEENKIESAICRDKTTGKWRFINSMEDYSSPFFRAQFKDSMNELLKPERSKDKEAYSEFIRLVFEYIQKNNRSCFNDSFEIYIACPSGWDTNGDGKLIKEYKDFMSNFMPVKWVIKESDAAYFKFKNKIGNSYQSVLVIDIGSSTIDFTFYGNGVNTSLSDGKRHGASFVERNIFEYFKKNDNDFNIAQREAEDVCNKQNLNWKGSVIHYIKKKKEDFYTNVRTILNLDFHNNIILPNLKKRIFDSIRIFKNDLEDNILSDYVKDLTEDFKEVQQKITTPNYVVLTGGASRMPWLQELVQNVFNESIVERDEEPSYVVSDGIALYAYAVYKLKKQLIEIIKNFWSTNNDDVLKQLISDYFNESLKEIQLPKIKAICDSFDNGELTYNQKDFEDFGYNPEYEGYHCTAVFIPAMKKHNDNILTDNNNKISNAVNESMNINLRNNIVGKINEIFVESMHFTPNININVNVNIDVKGLGINNEWDETAITELTHNIYADIIFKGNLYKDRTKTAVRQKFTSEFYEIQESANVILPTDMLQSAVESLKKSIESELTVDKMLQKCLFTIYK